MKTTVWVQAYGELPRESITSSGIGQDYPLSLFLSYVFAEILLDNTHRLTFQESNLQEKFFDLEYSDDIVLFEETADKMRSFDHFKQQYEDV